MLRKTTLAASVFAAAGLIAVIGLRWTGLSSLSAEAGFAALVIALTSGRAAMTLMLARGDYARADGAANEAAKGVTFNEAVIAIAIAAATGAIFGGVAGFIAALAPVGLAFAWLAYVTRRLDGYTGDTLGAMEQIGQIAVFLILAGA